jgi:hypothetical protein
MAAPLNIKIYGWILLPVVVSHLIYQVSNVVSNAGVVSGIGILDTAILPLLTIAAIVCAMIFSGKKFCFYLLLAGAYFLTNLAALILYARTDGYFGLLWLFKVLLGNFLPVNYLFWQWGPALLIDLAYILLIVSLALSLFDRPSTTAPKKSTSSAVLNSQKRTQQTGAQIEGDAVAQIEKLGDLLKKGLITQGEFESKKKQILGI